MRTPLTVRGVRAAVSEYFDAAGWTRDVLVAGHVAVRIDLEKRAVPVNGRGLVCWRLSCRRAGGFNTGWIIG